MRAPFLLFALLVGGTAHAAVVPVEDPDGLLAAIAAAVPGDELVLADGTYRLTGATCAAEGSAAAPIVVRAASPLGAVIEFDGLEGFKVTGAHWHFEGLEVVGVCADHADCEHAFHVIGGAHGFQLRNSRVRDFNAQLKVNAAELGGAWVQPDDGLVERSEFFDSAPRQTSTPVTKLNIDTGRRWIVRDSYVHDFGKAGGDGISYGAFMKSGGEEGLFERNLVVCTTDGAAGDTRIGLSFGGGGTAPQFCAPAFDAGAPCDVEHSGGTMRNNIVAGCSDVGIYLNRAAETKLLFNTLIATSGIDFRFATSSGVAHGNLYSGAIRDRDGASHEEESNLAVDRAAFDGWYEDPARGDLRLRGDVGELVGQASAHQDVSDDYCVRDRPASPTYGALEHGLGDCATVPPPGPAEPGGGGSGGAGGGGGSENPGGAGGGGSGGTGGTGGTGGRPPIPYEVDTDDSNGDGGCGCTAGSAGTADALLVLAALRFRRRPERRSASPRDEAHGQR